MSCEERELSLEPESLWDAVTKLNTFGFANSEKWDCLRGFSRRWFECCTAARSEERVDRVVLLGYVSFQE